MKDWIQIIATFAVLATLGWNISISIATKADIHRLETRIDLRLDRIEQKIDGHISNYAAHNTKQSNP